MVQRREEILGAPVLPGRVLGTGYTWGRALVRFVRAKPLGGVGLVLLLMASVMAVFAPLLAPFDPEETIAGARLLPPSAQHWFGTDHLGRDLFSRVIYGARISLLVGASTVLLGSFLGTIIGVLTGYFGRHLDLLTQRLVDAVSAFPHLILALIIVAVLGRGILPVILALSIVNTPMVARTVRSVTLSIKEAQYVEAAWAIGAWHPRILLHYILPNCMAPLIVIASITLGWAIVVEASLSFLGVGVPPDVPSWGGSLSGPVQRYFVLAPWLAIFPGLALSITVFGINLLGDALRDALDPHLRKA